MPVYGVTSKDGISGYLKCYITQDDVTVVGYIGEGATKTLTSNWAAPFESDTLGQSSVRTGAAIGQELTGMTTVSQFNSTMIWQGTTPPTVNLPVYLQAYADAKSEVQDAITQLEMMASPNPNAYTPGGRPPDTVTIDIGRRFKVTDVVILDVSSELDAPRTKDGYMTRNTVTLTLTPKQMIKKQDIQNLYS